MGQLMESRLNQLQPQDEAEPETEPAEQEEEETEEAQPENEDVLSNEQDLEKEADEGIDIDSLSAEELQELGEKIGSRAATRIAELTRKRKEAEERLASLEQKFESKEENKNPLEPEDVEDNPYSDIQKVEDLQAKYKDAVETIEWAETVLEDSDDYGAEDVVKELDGESYTKRDIRQILRNARKAKDLHLPAQLQNIQQREQEKQLKKQLESQAAKELPWMEAEDNDKKQYLNSVMGDKRLTKAFEASPQLEPYLHYLIPHAIESIWSKRTQEKPKSAAKPKPPSSPQSSGAKSSSPDAESAKRLKELESRFQKTGSSSDLAAIRKHKHSQFK